MGLCFWRMPFQEKHVFDRTSFLFFCVMYWPWDSLFHGMMAWTPEKKVILKERASGMYRLSAYFWSKSVSNIPVVTILPTFFWIISYWMCGLNPSFLAFIGSYGILLLSIVAGMSIGLFFGVSVPDFKTALTVMMIVIIGQLLLGGFFIRTLPSVLTWIKYGAIFYYPYQVLLILEFHGRSLICDDSQRILQCQGKKQIAGEEVAKALGVEMSIRMAITGLIILAVSCRIGAYISLRWLPTNQGRTR